jgi:hypothetical protein
MTNTVKTQTLSKEAQNLFIKLVRIQLSGYKKTSLNMVLGTIEFYSKYIPFNKVSVNYLVTLCHNNGIKAKQD